MLNAVILQFVFVAVVTAIAALWFGARSAWSVVLGGFSVLIPSLLFLLYLKFTIRFGGRGLTVVSLVVGQFLKIMVTLGLMFAAHRLYGVHWPWLIIGLIAAIKANLFAHLLKK